MKKIFSRTVFFFRIKLPSGILLGVLFFLNFFIVNLSADNTADKKEQSITERYNDILNYGIEKEVMDILPLLGTNPKKEFLTLIYERYKNSTLAESKIQYIDFFSKCDNLFDDIRSSLYLEAKDSPNNIRLHSKLLDFISKKGNTQEQLLLIERLSSFDEVIKISAAESLSQLKNPELGKYVLERLEIADKDSEKYLSNDIKAKLVLALGEMNSKESIPYLRTTVSDSANDKMIVMFGMVSLAEMKDAESIKIIAKNLSSEEPKVKEYAAYALSVFESKEVLPILREMLKNDSDKIRIYAVQGILLNKDSDSIKLLMYKYRNDPSSAVRKEALSALLSLGVTGINTLNAYIKEKDFSENDLAVLSEAVRKNPDESSVSFILSLYEKADKKKKDAIIKNLLFGTSNKLDRFIDVVLKSEDPYARMNAVKTIYQTKDSSLWLRVKELSEKDPNENVRKIAKNYLDLRVK